VGGGRILRRGFADPRDGLHGFLTHNLVSPD
jgi:hypothetical protein